MDKIALIMEPGRLKLDGPMTASSLAPIWRRALEKARAAQQNVQPLTIDLSSAPKIDMAGITLLLALEQAHPGVTFEGLGQRPATLLARLRKEAKTAPPPPARAPIPRRGAALAQRVRDGLAFLGDITLAIITLPANLRFFRAADFFRLADQAGGQALPLILMLGYLIGMILAFQSAVPMRQFGADLYVADLVAIALFRELGPLLCAVILAGRTGSAFAAELGTMQVNEEIAALQTMGIDPATMLVLPRAGAMMLVLPGLTMAMDVAGLAGMATVLMLFGFPPAVIAAHVATTANVGRFLVGLAKSIPFGLAVALVGCRAGLSAGLGPRAVGEAATAAVVGGIVWTILLDGLFAVFSYRMHL